MKAIAICIILAALAGCGVDGAPIRPEKKGAPIGITLTGTAEVGIVGGSVR